MIFVLPVQFFVYLLDMEGRKERLKGKTEGRKNCRQVRIKKKKKVQEERKKAGRKK